MTTVPMVRSFMVLGSDAGVGKTLVTCAVVHSLCEAGVQTIAMKPATRGAISDNGTWHSSEMLRLAAVSAFGLPPRALCPYLLPPAGGALAAGGTAHVEPTFDTIVDTFRVLSTWGDAVVIEGADGLCDSRGFKFDSADLAWELKLPFVAVVGLRPGCVAPALANLAAWAGRGLECVGWITNQVDPALTDARQLVAALAAAMPGPCLGAIPRLSVCAPATVARSIDMERTLSVLAP